MRIGLLQYNRNLKKCHYLSVGKFGHHKAESYQKRTNRRYTWKYLILSEIGSCQNQLWPNWVKYATTPFQNISKVTKCTKQKADSIKHEKISCRRSRSSALERNVCQFTWKCVNSAANSVRWKWVGSVPAVFEDSAHHPVVRAASTSQFDDAVVDVVSEPLVMAVRTQVQFGQFQNSEVASCHLQSFP